MPPALLADLVVMLHFAFVAFVVGGGLLALHWPRVAWVHVPTAAWGALIEFAGWICPLTPLENRLRQQAGEDAYTGDFVARYILPVLYPEGLTREVQVTLGAGVVLLNAAIYAVAVRRARSAAARD
ncbi:MAG: DUF2784 domain-containing protein [Vicinamibacterales bacterium]